MAQKEDHTAGSTESDMSIEEALAELAARDGHAVGRAAGKQPPPFGTWNPFATRVEGRSAGAHVGGGWKITHHTTEGRTASGAIAAYRQHGGWPHFTAQWERGRMLLFQHLPLEVAGRALVNPPDQWETNRARTIQIEHVGFARATAGWSLARYAAIGRLCGWIEERTGCPRRVMRGVSFPRPHRLSPRTFHSGAGHHGHVHVPGSDHTDPGRGFRIGVVLAKLDRPQRAFRSGVQGPDVVAFQRAVNARAHGCRRPDRALDVDGIVGPETVANGAWAAWILGVGRSQAEIRRRGISPRVQQLVRDPSMRNETQRQRAVGRRRRHCGKLPPEDLRRLANRRACA
jgi:hypothetical protein